MEIDLEDNYEVELLKAKADLTLLSFIERNCSLKEEKDQLYRRIKLFDGAGSRKANLTLNSHYLNMLEHVKNMVISFLCEIDEREAMTSIQKIKRQADDLNQFQLEKKKSEILDKQLYEHIALHFLGYFTNKQLGSIIEVLRQTRKKILYETQIQNQVFLLYEQYPQIDFPVNICSKFTCHCQMPSTANPLFELQKECFLRCQRCYSAYHSTCQTNLLYCCKCQLIQNSAQTQIKEVLKVFYVYPHKFINAVRFQLPAFQSYTLQHNKKWFIQLRVQKVLYKKSNSASMMFNDNYSIVLNNQTIKPSIRGGGHSIKIPTKNLSKSNILIIKRSNINKIVSSEALLSGKYPVFLVGIFKVEKLAINTYKPKTITTSQSQLFLEKVLQQQQTPDLKFNLYDLLSQKKIQIPVRGFNCLHFRCFDWKSYKQLLKTNLKDIPDIFLRNKINLKMIGKLNKSESEIGSKLNKAESESVATDINNLQNLSPNPSQVKDPKRRSLKRAKKIQRKLMRCPICQCSVQGVYIDPIASKVLKITAEEITEVQIDAKGSIIEQRSQEGFIDVISIDIE